MRGEVAEPSRVLGMGRLYAVIAHEVRQPLAAMAANANAGLHWLKGETPRVAMARRSLTRIARDSARAGQIVARIGALARHESNLRRRQQRISLNATIHDAVELMDEPLRRSGATLRLDLLESLEPVCGDVVLLREVLVNLITNALEAMATVSSRPKRVYIGSRRERDGHVQVTVRDTGVGLESDALGRAFEPFFTTKSDGLGLGLAICRAIIEEHGGRLWVGRAGRGRGATVQFTLPPQKQRKR